MAAVDVAALVREWEAARRERDWVRADELRAQLRSLGVSPEQRPAADKSRYDEAWAERTLALRFISTEGYLASSACWRDGPKLQQFKPPNPTEDKSAREAMALRLGRALVRRLRGAGPCVLCVEKPYLAGLLSASAEAAAAAEAGADAAAEAALPPFVLLAVNGGDAPLTRDEQARLSGLAGLRACYANNLHAPATAELARVFHPLPLGVPATSAPPYFEAALRRARAEAPPWAARDARLLVAPMRASSRLRTQYLAALSGPEFAPHVRVVHGRLPLEAFLALLGEHRSTLSPPGRGHDCFRTWQALAVGTVPLVPRDEAFDRRLLEGTGAAEAPPPERLSAEGLRQILDALHDPSPDAGAPPRALEMAHWRRVWERHLAAEAP